MCHFFKIHIKAIGRVKDMVFFYFITCAYALLGFCIHPVVPKYKIFSTMIRRPSEMHSMFCEKTHCGFILSQVLSYKVSDMLLSDFFRG